MISKRLYTITKMLEHDLIVADIGSDHALLACYLILNKLAKKVYAIDNKEQPLKASIENINKYQLNAHIKAILGDGLSNLPSDTEAIIIAGMGEKNIIEILNNDLDKAKKFKEIILQANKSQIELKKFLNENNFAIIKEAFVSENNHDYLIISARYDEININSNNPYLSEYLLAKKDQAYLIYLKNRYLQLSDILKYRNDRDIVNEYQAIKKALNL